MENNHNTYLKGVAVQVTAILLASLGAVLISSAQSLTAGTLPCDGSVANPAEAGLLGGLLKGVHSALVVGRGTMHS